MCEHQLTLVYVLLGVGCTTRVLTLFSKALPLDVAARVMDNFFYEGDQFLLRAVVGLLALLAPRLEAGCFDDCLQLLTHLPPDLDDDLLFSHIAAVPTSPKKFQHYCSLQGLPS